MQNNRPKPYIFILMPFNNAFSDVYELGIKAACKDVGAYCERVDEQVFQESILERIYNQISKSDIIISDMSGRNPNVFYETGYAHALGKKVILLTKDSNDIPFDLKHYPHIIYGESITFLKNELTKRIIYYIENPSKPAFDPQNTLEFLSGGLKIEKGINLILPEENLIADRNDLRTMIPRHLEFEFDFTTHNNSNKVLDASDIVVSLIVPDTIQSVYIKEYGRLPDGNNIVNIGNLKKYLPDEWSVKRIRFARNVKTRETNISSKIIIQLQLCISSPINTTYIPFTLSLV